MIPVPEHIKSMLMYVVSLEVILTSILIWMGKAVEGIDIIIRYGVSIAGLIIAGLTILKLLDHRKETKLTMKREALEIKKLRQEIKKFDKETDVKDGDNS